MATKLYAQNRLSYPLGFPIEGDKVVGKMTRRFDKDNQPVDIVVETTERATVRTLELPGANGSRVEGYTPQPIEISKEEFEAIKKHASTFQIGSDVSAVEVFKIDDDGKREWLFRSRDLRIND